MARWVADCEARAAFEGILPTGFGACVLRRRAPGRGTVRASPRFAYVGSTNGRTRRLEAGVHAWVGAGSGERGVLHDA